ncbi:MAG TPA: hypothetical protein PKD59_12020 [Miltoncostaeaceae bacterium]|nr:hypothetical protein [Miltoncostaeaceae bacterium]
MDWWMLGVALAVLLAWSAWDVGRPARAERSALLLMRTVGGLGLIAMAALALEAGSDLGALVAAAGAAPLLLGLLGGAVREPRRSKVPRAVPAPRVRPAAQAAVAADDGRERRAA